MRRLVSSDWQLCDNPRDRYRTDFVVKQLPQMLVKHQVDQLLVLGDITEQKDNHPAPLVNEIVNTLCMISEYCEIIILQGNHDFLHNAHPFFAFLQNWKGIEWISKPTVKDNCLWLPHTRDHKKDWEGIDFTGRDYIFAHNIFTGVSTQTGHALAGIPPSIFPDDTCCISGDVHEPQVLADGKIIYVGSPTLCDFGDDYQPRVLLLDDLKIKSIKVYGQQKRLINYFWTTGRIDSAANPNDIVKINVHLEMKDVAEWATIREQVEQWATKNSFIVNTIAPIIAYEQGERQQLVRAQSKSDLQYIDSFVNRLGVDKRTAQVGRQVIDLV